VTDFPDALAGPWRIAENEHNLACAPWSGAVAIEAPNDEGSGSVPAIVCWMTRPNGADGAALIVEAVNQHDGLVAALNVAREVIDDLLNSEIASYTMAPSSATQAERRAHVHPHDMGDIALLEDALAKIDRALAPMLPTQGEPT
jgi:hypothetical protein